MPVRNIVRIDADKCNGCGLCVKACVEGAIKLIDGKAVLVKDEYCDGLGACLPACPADAIRIEKREAPEFDEKAALAHAAAQGHPPTPPHRHAPPAAHASHDGCPGARLLDFSGHAAVHSGCPSARLMSFAAAPADAAASGEATPSALRQWPVQLGLVPPTAPFLKDADVVLVADCVPFAYPDFHRNLLAGKVVLVACPKLDNVPAHVEKLTAVFRQSGLRSVTVVRMEVPCCGGLLRAAQEAHAAAGSGAPLDEVVIGIRGDLLSDTRS